MRFSEEQCSDESETDAECSDESETDAECSDDSHDDPDFDVVEETRLTLSDLSVDRKVKRLKSITVKGMDEEVDQVELDEQDQKSYETIHKIIEGGQVDRLKIEQCKIYLRKHGLRLSGNKETLIMRIKEHIDIVNGDGERKYPPSSFVLNCKGDACMGDIVLFEQKVYEEFSIVSRSAKGGPCGKRVVAGRILKESYGAAKQQHTFTIEVLWSKGEKALPPLHPLLVKGRNLYRSKTMRQKWEDEGERQKILLEKHARGGTARLNREARVQQREMRKMHQPTRATRSKSRNRKQGKEKREPPPSVSMEPSELINQPKDQPQRQQQQVHCHTTTWEPNVPLHPANLHGKPREQHFTSMNCSFQRGGYPGSQFSQIYSSTSAFRPEIFHEVHVPSSFPVTNHLDVPVQWHTFKENLGYMQQNHAYHRQNLNAAARYPPVQHKSKQKCRYYAQGRCTFGDRCKFLHELAGNK